MKFSSARSHARSRLPLIALLALTASMGIAGCENDGGAGPAGPGGGDTGQTGPTGPTGPADVPISQGGDVSNVGTGSTLTAQQIADIGTLVASIDSAAITGNKPVIEITVKTDKGGAVLGLAATTLRLGVAKLVPAANGLPSRWQSYINRSGTPSIATPVLASAVQANTESGVAAGWQELGAGKYRYASAVDLSAVTTPIAVGYDPALTHRISIAIDMTGSARALAPDNPFKDFVPNGGALTSSKHIAATANCTTCHVRFGEHGGPRRSAEYCAVCHNPATIDPDSGESVDLAYMAHSIHRGEDRSTAYVVYGFNGARFDTGEVTYPQPIAFCETCHVKSASTPDGDDWKTNPGAASCGGCHDTGLNKTGPDAATGLYTYTYTHSGIVLTANDNECQGCHRDDGVAGGILETHQQETDRKSNRERQPVHLQDPQHRERGCRPGAEGDLPDPRHRRPADERESHLHGPAAPRLCLVDCRHPQRCRRCGRPVPGQSWRGHRHRPDRKPGQRRRQRQRHVQLHARAGAAARLRQRDSRQGPDGRARGPARHARWLRGLSGKCVRLRRRRPREQLVDQAKCETCHKRLALHGGSRAGDPIICTVCHNSSVGGTFDTDTFGPLALGAFIHNLHASNVVPFGAVTYPQSLARCDGLPRGRQGQRGPHECTADHR